MKKLILILLIFAAFQGFSQNWETNTYSDYQPSKNKYSSKEISEHKKKIGKDLREIIESIEKNVFPNFEYYLLDSENCELLFKRKCKSIQKRLNTYKEMYHKLTFTKRYYEERKALYRSFDWITEMRYELDKQIRKNKN